MFHLTSYDVQHTPSPPLTQVDASAEEGGMVLASSRLSRDWEMMHPGLEVQIQILNIRTTKK